MWKTFFHYKSSIIVNFGISVKIFGMTYKEFVIIKICVTYLLHNSSTATNLIKFETVKGSYMIIEVLVTV